MRGRVVLLSVAAIAASASALTKAYSVEPVKAAWSGKAAPGDGVCQTVTCSFDTPIYAEFFTGMATAQEYQVQLRLPGEKGLVVAHGHRYIGGSQVWVRCTLELDYADSVVKGRTYEVRWTLDGGTDSLVYYYDSTDAYDWGEIALPGQRAPDPESRDLVCRVYGLMDPVDSSYWGATALLPCDYDRPPDNALMRHEWQQKLKGKADWGSFYVHWDTIQSVRFDSFYYAKLDTQLICMDSADVEPVPCLVRCPKWASTRFQRYPSDHPPPDSFLDTCVYSPPRGLWANPDSGDTNLWAAYVESLVNHVDEFCGDTMKGIHTWEIWNEPNEGCTLSPSFPRGWPGYTGWWRPPNDTFAYKDISPDAHDMCSLYVRLCEVADSVIRSDPDHEEDRILIGAVSRVSEAIPRMSKVKGKWWVDTCYRVADSVFWDGVSAHPYQYQAGFSEQLLEQDGADLRAVMRVHGHHEGLLWNTELGWSMPKPSGRGSAEPVAADNAAKLFTTSLAALGSPDGGFDRTCWWFSWEKYLGTWPLLQGRHSSSSTPLRQTAILYAFGQSMEQLVGMRFNRRVLLGDARDDSIRLYEFGNLDDRSRTYVGWVIDIYGKEENPVEVEIPLRSDRFDAVLVDYDGNPPSAEADLCDNGWLSVVLTSRPVFVTETGPASRPDITVDSVAVSRSRHSLPRATAWLKNVGNRQTPDDDEHPTEVMFCCDGDSAATTGYDQPIYPGETVKVGVVLGPEFDRNCLVSATANPRQLYVELYGLDDNTGYALVREEE
jgi:hypothetical protein